jgi:predicted transcriptional regulator
VGVTEEERPLLSAFTFEELHAELTRRAAILANVPEVSLLAELSRRDQTLTTVRAIADFCGYDPETIHRYAQQDVDPLPHGYDARGRMTAKKSALAAWLGRRTSKLATKGKRARTVNPLAKGKRT